MSKHFDHIKDLTASLFIKTMGLLPVSLAQRIGYFMGYVAWLLPNPTKRIARINIDLCMSELNVSERRELLKRATLHHWSTLFEMPSLWRHSFASNQTLIKETHNEELLDAALADERGVMLIVPHLGNWEVFNIFMATKTNATAIYQSAKLPSVQAIIHASRNQSNTEMLPATTAGIRKLLKKLRTGGCSAALPDLEPELTGGIYSHFFDVPALSTILVSKLIKQTNSIPIMATAQRIGMGQGYRVVFQTCSEGLSDRELQTSVDALNNDTEAMIRDCPEQYMWSYKRFKHREDGKPNVYDVR